MEKFIRVKRQRCMSKNWIYSWLWKSSKTRLQYCRLESFAMKTDILMNGSTVKNHFSLKTVFGYSATRRTSFRSWFLVCQRVLPPVFPLQLQWHLQSRRLIILLLPQVHLLHQLWLCHATVRIEQRQTCAGTDSDGIRFKFTCWTERTGRLVDQANQKSKTKKKNENHEKERGDPLYFEIPEWLQEFRENLVDDEILERGDSHASSSHEVSLEPTSTRSEDLGIHSVYTHFPKDRNGETCKSTKITRAPCRKRNGGAVPRAENFGDLMTADHKVLSEGCEISKEIIDMQSWCRTYPLNGSKRIRAKQKLHRKLKEACKSSWSRIGNVKSFTLTIPWNFAKPVKIFPGIIVRLHHTDRKQMGLRKEQFAE